ncbi:MAG: GNAT family N-acetyltransferase [Succinivibrio sp.]|nr:GNAT family N-acetyltransferase [Succinivibrio sp.]
MKFIDGESYLPQVLQMIETSALNLNQDTAFQHFENELRDAQAKYLPPHGNLIVAENDGEFQGMVAYTRINDERCEMKRLYVRREARGQHLGEQLVDKILEKAKEAGFVEMITIMPSSLSSVINLCDKHGFENFSEEGLVLPENNICLIRDL